MLSCEFAKFLRSCILRNISGRLLLSMVSDVNVRRHNAQYCFIWNFTFLFLSHHSLLQILKSKDLLFDEIYNSFSSKHLSQCYGHGFLIIPLSLCKSGKRCCQVFQKLSNNVLRCNQELRHYT